MNNSTEIPLADQVKGVIKENWNILFLAILIVSIGQLSLGLVFPLLPWIHLDFKINQNLAEGLIVSYLIGYGPSQLFYGPLSYVYGRRHVLLIGLLISILGLGIILTFHHDFYILIIGRFIQGAGGGCESVIARSMLHDSYKNKFFLSAMTGLSIISAFTPIFSPIMGGLVNHHFGWFAVFICLFIYTVLGFLILLLYLPETLTMPRVSISFIAIFQYYGALLKDRYFLSYAMIGWVNWALVIFSGSLAPFILESQLHITSENYAYWSIIPAVAFLFSSTLCFILRKSYGTHHIVFIAPVIQLSVVIIFLSQPMSLLTLTIGFIGVAIAQALIYPCSQSLLLVPYSNQLGTVSALSGGGQMLFSAIFIFIAWQLNLDNFYSLTAIIFITSVIGLLFALLGKRCTASAPLENELFK
ncbi:MFS transporter [Photobacterium angustum]|uniref:MFS transporter n=1 Tax=Photobacterium angustum TaxID=661 RepID=UPI0005EAFC71|nr:MFS transporter [Photobacterium angustum]PSW93040.1 MFS transporter [Photobacterium angustum]PSX01121.1 MFS transporter [Photobacterium angustum]PSX31997.1 MFS transporter [Photobacterium angustum]